MALRNIRITGDSILEKVCKPVKEINKRTSDLIDDMFETMYDAGGVGLAAPQVGVLKRICVIDITPDGTDPHVFVNPEIIERSEELQTGYEGCLSYPGKSGIVSRAERVTVKAFDRDMQPFTLEGEGLMARAMQHEIDHLDGHMYMSLVEGDIVDNSELYAEEEEDGDGGNSEDNIHGDT